MAVRVTPAQRQIGILDLGHVAGNGEALPADGNAEVIGAGRERRDVGGLSGVHEIAVMFIDLDDFKAVNDAAVVRYGYSRDEFLSIASHELKTPLTTLQLQIQGLARR